MANELENSIRNAAEQVVRYIAQASEMKVETAYVQIGPNGETDFAQAKPAARTVIKLDGDSSIVVPLRSTQNGGLEIDSELLSIHERAVTTTIEYRSKILQSLLGLLQSRSR